MTGKKKSKAGTVEVPLNTSQWLAICIMFSVLERWGSLKNHPNAESFYTIPDGGALRSEIAKRVQRAIARKQKRYEGSDKTPPADPAPVPNFRLGKAQAFHIGLLISEFLLALREETFAHLDREAGKELTANFYGDLVSASLILAGAGASKQGKRPARSLRETYLAYEGEKSARARGLTKIVYTKARPDTLKEYAVLGAPIALCEGAADKGNLMEIVAHALNMDSSTLKRANQKYKKSLLYAILDEKLDPREPLTNSRTLLATAD